MKTIAQGSSSHRRHEQRLEFLVRAGEIFHRSLDIDATLHNVARVAVESFSDLCLFDLLDERSERLYVTAAAYHDPALAGCLGQVQTLLYDAEYQLHPALRVIQSGQPIFIPVVDEAAIALNAASREHANMMRKLGYRSKIVVPVTAQEDIFGALTFVLTRDDEYFDEADVNFAVEIGRRAGLAIANAKRYQREQYVAETLQRAFMTDEFPNCEDLRFFALYRPGSSAAELGGDWYDAFRTHGGKLCVTIGDIAGKGIEAARTMVQVREAIRIASIRCDDPAAMLAIVNDTTLIDGGDQLATVFVGLIDMETRTLSYASAGHVPPFLRSRDGHVTQLASPSPPLGISRDIVFESHVCSIADASLLVLYTDGITEISRDVVTGEQMLERVLATDAVAHAANPARFIERTIADDAPRDDIAILALQFGAHDLRWRFDAGDTRAAYAIKSEFLRALSEVAPLDLDQTYACQLIFGELIGNAVRHASGSLSIGLDVKAGVTLHVIDEGPGFDYDPHLPYDVWSESGRGLYLISQLARDVRVSRLPGLGSHVAVELPVNA